MTRLPSIAAKNRLPAGISPLQLYLQEIAKYPLLTPEEEYETARKHFDEGDVAAAHRLVTANLRLVVRIANDFRRTTSNVLDLIQEGNYGLMQAVKRFNPYKGVKLSSYAAWWIRAYILRYIMDNRSQVRIGTTAAQRKLYYNLRKETDRLLAQYDEVDTKLLAESLEVKEKEVVEMQMRLGGSDVSLDAPLYNSDGESNATAASFIASNTATAEEVILSNELQEKFGVYLKDFEKTLKGRDLEIFRDRMIAENPLTLQEFGDRYGITRERARQIEARVLSSLKRFVQDQGFIDV